MKKTKIMFFFDTEDFTSEYAAEAILRYADLFEKEGITAHFATVGLMAEKLVEWKRYDIINAMKKHCIGTHSYSHSVHPLLCEATDTEDYSDAVKAIYPNELKTVEILKKCFDKDRILFAVPPGNSLSYAAMYTYSELGIPYYCDALPDFAPGAYFCGAHNIPYGEAFESILPIDDKEIELLLDKIAEKQEFILYTHPHIAMYSVHWDKVNYDKKNIYQFDKWEEAPRRTPEETEEFFSGVEKIVKAIKNDSRFNITSLYEHENETKNNLDLVKPEMLGKFLTALDSGELYFSYDGKSCSKSELFGAVTNMLIGKAGTVPKIGYGFLNEPYGISKDTELTRSEVISAADQIKQNEFLPDVIYAGEKKIGPADYLAAGMRFLTCDDNNIIISPRIQLGDLNKLPSLRDFKLKGTWIYADDFMDNYVTDRLRLQLWSYKK